MDLSNKEYENSTEHPCYDCGSTIPHHHTPLCDFSEEGDILDLPQKPGTQHWDKSKPRILITT